MVADYARPSGYPRPGRGRSILDLGHTPDKMDTNSGAEVLDLQLSAEPFSHIPDLSARIWRYMDLAKFVSMLQNQALYFSVVAKLGDDMEAASPRLPSGADPFQQQSVFGLWSLCRCITFASCWHLAEDESAAMWSIYSGRDQGIAVQSTLKALSIAFPSPSRRTQIRSSSLGVLSTSILSMRRYPHVSATCTPRS